MASEKAVLYLGRVDRPNADDGECYFPSNHFYHFVTSFRQVGYRVFYLHFEKGACLKAIADQISFLNNKCEFEFALFEIRNTVSSVDPDFVAFVKSHCSFAIGYIFNECIKHDVVDCLLSWASLIDIFLTSEREAADYLGNFFSISYVSSVPIVKHDEASRRLDFMYIGAPNPRRTNLLSEVIKSSFVFYISTASSASDFGISTHKYMNILSSAKATLISPSSIYEPIVGAKTLSTPLTSLRLYESIAAGCVPLYCGAYLPASTSKRRPVVELSRSLHPELKYGCGVDWAGEVLWPVDTAMDVINSVKSLTDGSTVNLNFWTAACRKVYDSFVSPAAVIDQILSLKPSKNSHDYWISEGKHWRQSSSSVWSPEAGVMTNFLPAKEFFFHGSLEEKPWWTLDLGEEIVASRVRVLNRDSVEFAQRAKKLRIFIGITLENLEQIFDAENAEWDCVSQIDIDLFERKFRFLKVTLADTGILHLRDVRVLGRPA